MQLNWCRTDAKSVTPQGYSPNFSSLVPIHSPGLREVSCPRTKHNVHGQHSNPDHSIRRTLGETCNSRRRSFQFWELKFLINDKLDHVVWKELIYLLWTMTRRFSWCTVIRVIREHKSLSESTQRSTPQVLLSNALWDSLRTKESSVCLGFNLARIESSAFSSRWMT